MRLRLAILFTVSAALFLLSTAGCKKADTEVAAPEDESPVQEPADEAAPDDAPAEEPAADSEGANADADAGVAAAAPVGALDVPEDWNQVSVKTPKGATIAIGLPGEWVELPPSNEATLLEWGAPEGNPAAGTRVTAVTLPFDGDLKALADYNKKRLASFAEIHEEGPVRMGNMDGYQFLASWKTAVGNRDTMQLLMATGTEGVGLTCVLGEGQLNELRALCTEIFATQSLTVPKGAKKKKKKK